MDDTPQQRDLPGMPAACPMCGSLVATLAGHSRDPMQILRHSKIAVTMQTYTEVPSAATRAARNKPRR